MTAPIAALIAPQSLWPRIITTFTPRTAIPYSVLPSVPLSMLLPAIRETKMLPRSTSKTSSGEIRESAQVMIAANGFCSDARFSPTGE